MFDFNWTLIFEWCMVECESKNKHQKTCVEMRLEYVFSINGSKVNHSNQWESGAMHGMRAMDKAK